MTDGEGADSAPWCAGWLLRRSELPDLLGRPPVRSELLRDEEFVERPPGGPWERCFGARLFPQFSDPPA